jgi:hypothetical protein
MLDLWQHKLPEDSRQSWDWLLSQDQGSILDTFFPLNRSEMFWQGVTRRFLGKSSGKELDFDEFEVDCGVVAGSFALDA